jgi:hypothetical protein
MYLFAADRSGDGVNVLPVALVIIVLVVALYLWRRQR